MVDSALSPEFEQLVVDTVLLTGDMSADKQMKLVQNIIKIAEMAVKETRNDAVQFLEESFNTKCERCGVLKFHSKNVVCRTSVSHGKFIPVTDVS